MYELSNLSRAMKLTPLTWVVCFLLLPILTSIADPPQPLDLRPFGGRTQFEHVGVDWLLPRGAQVIDGIRWQLNGAVVVRGTKGASTQGVTNIPVGCRFELVDSNGVPMAGVELRLSRNWDWQVGNPHPNFNDVVTTDVGGRFLFTNVPPGRLDVIRFLPMNTAGGGQGYTSQPQTWFDAEPGRTNELGKVIFDTPPPPPLNERVKQKLGL